MLQNVIANGFSITHVSTHEKRLKVALNHLYNAYTGKIPTSFTVVNVCNYVNTFGQHLSAFQCLFEAYLPEGDRERDYCC